MAAARGGDRRQTTTGTVRPKPLVRMDKARCQRPRVNSRRFGVRIPTGAQKPPGHRPGVFWLAERRGTLHNIAHGIFAVMPPSAAPRLPWPAERRECRRPRGGDRGTGVRRCRALSRRSHAPTSAEPPSRLPRQRWRARPPWGGACAERGWCCGGRMRMLTTSAAGLHAIRVRWIWSRSRPRR